MQSEWPEYRLDEVTELISDCPHSTPKWKDSGVIVLRNQNIRNGRLDLTSPSFTDEAGYFDRIKRAIPEVGDLVLTREAPMGDICQIPEELKCCLGQRMVLLRPDRSRIDSTYLLYAMQSPYLQHQISWNEGTGTTVSNIRIPNIKAFNIPTPEISEQKAIAHILGSLDDKIELNRQMNATLEAIAQALFKSWFVDFDPVLDNALAAGNPIPDELQDKAAARAALGDARKPLPEDIAALFPAAFVWTEEMGWIPEGWDVGKLEDHCSITMGQSPKGDSYNTVGEGTPLVNGPVEFGEYFTEKTKWTTEPIRFSENGDLIVCVRGSTTGRFVKSDDRYCLGRGVCAIRGKISQTFSDCLFKECLPTFLRFTTGSTFPSWNAPTIKSFTVIKPDAKLIESFDSLAAPMIEQQGHLNKINTGASLLRDTLLPKLLSGELRIPDAEKLVEDALV